MNCSLDGNNVMDVSVFMEALVGYFMGIAQSNNPDPSEWNVVNVCEVMTDENYGLPIHRLAYLMDSEDDYCLDNSYDSFLFYVSIILILSVVADHLGTVSYLMSSSIYLCYVIMC